jgi:putative (di)nucleoside polyphosphate hydrolase
MKMKKYSSDIIIADSTLGDEKGLVFVLKTTWLATYPDIEHGITKEDILTKDFTSEKKISAWRDTIKNSGKKSKYICVAKHNNKVVGFCSASKKKKFNELGVLYILPEYQRMGIGRKLMDRAVDWLGRKKKIFLKVASYNKNAISFYERYGFIKTGATSRDRLINGKVMPETEMALNLKQFKNLPYRKNVGALFLKGDKYLLVQLSDGFWKMPQGGVHNEETGKEAIIRELKEELGTDKFKIIKQFPFRHQYDWDEGTLRHTNYRWRGQKQKFFLVKFTGYKIIIDKEELRDYKWLTKNELLKAVDSNHPLLKGYRKLVEKLLQTK